MKGKGQALVEFILILPIFLLLLLSIIDIGKVIYFGNTLEYRMDQVVSEYKKSKDIDKVNLLVKDLNIKVKIKDNSIYLNKDIEIITPGLNLIFGNPYKIEIKRVISNEE